MPDITISGHIGSEVDANNVKEQFSNVDPNADIEIDLSSPGGSVFQGVQMGHMIRDHKGKTTLTVSSIAASMGSHIMQNADVIKVHDDTAFMMHNPFMMTIGDWVELGNDSKLMKSVAVMLSGQYAKNSGQTKAEIQTLMNATTWLFGQEIVDAGFAHEVIATENPEAKDDAIAFGKLQFTECMAKLKEFEGAADDYKKIAALLPDPPKPAKIPVKPNAKKEEPMNEKEFLAFLETNPAAAAFYTGAMAYIKSVADTAPDLTAMALTDVLALAPVAATEQATAIEDARTQVEGDKLTAEQVKKIFAVCVSPEYAALAAIGPKVLTGKKSFSSFEDMVTMADQTIASLKLQGLIVDQPDATPGSDTNAGDDTNLNSPKMQSEIKKLQAVAGVN